MKNHSILISTQTYYLNSTTLAAIFSLYLICVYILDVNQDSVLAHIPFNTISSLSMRFLTNILLLISNDDDLQIQLNCPDSPLTKPNPSSFINPSALTPFQTPYTIEIITIQKLIILNTFIK